MLKRIVRLTLRNEASRSAFKQIYASRNPHKNGVKGCKEVKVMKDADHENVYYTVSSWDTLSDLQAYRNSEYFAQTWPMVKAQLSKKAEAFSLVEL